MKKIILCAMAMLLILSAALAEADPTAQLETILKREEAIQLEMKIVELELQLAGVNQDDAARILAEIKKQTLQDELTTLQNNKKIIAVQTVQAIMEEQALLKEQAVSLQTQLTDIQTALEENAAQQEELQRRYEEQMRLGALKRSAPGFMSEITVYVLLDDVGAISALHADTSRETPFIGSRCGEDEAFLSQFIGRVGPFTLNADVDALSGATRTSQAVVNAINSVYTPSEDATETFASTEYTASAKGLLSDVQVTIMLDESGAIAAMTVDCSGETPGIASPCAEEPFISQFIGRRGPFTDIDVIAGATYTSNAVINAVNSVFK